MGRDEGRQRIMLTMSWVQLKQKKNNDVSVSVEGKKGEVNRKSDVMGCSAVVFLVLGLQVIVVSVSRDKKIN